MNHSCGNHFHEWRDHQYYCPYIDGHSSRPFPCDSCGDRLNCEGEMVQRVCSHCGAKEWGYSADFKNPSCLHVQKKEENI